MDMVSDTWTATHTIAFVRLAVASLFTFALPYLTRFYITGEELDLPDVPFARCVEMSLRAGVFQDPRFVCVWPVQWAMSRAVVIYKFAVSAVRVDISLELFEAAIGSLTETLHHNLGSHIVQSIVVLPDVIDALGVDASLAILHRLGFVHYGHGVYRKCLNETNSVLEFERLYEDADGAESDLLEILAGPNVDAV